MRTCSHGYGVVHRWTEHDPLTQRDEIRVCREVETFAWFTETEETDEWWMVHDGYPADIPDEGVPIGRPTISGVFRMYEYVVRVNDRSLPKPPKSPKTTPDFNALPDPIWNLPIDDQRMMRERTNRMSDGQLASYARDRERVDEALRRMERSVPVSSVLRDAMLKAAKQVEPTVQTIAEKIRDAGPALSPIDYQRARAEAATAEQTRKSLEVMDERRRAREARERGLTPQQRGARFR